MATVTQLVPIGSTSTTAKVRVNEDRIQYNNGGWRNISSTIGELGTKPNGKELHDLLSVLSLDKTYDVHPKFGDNPYNAYPLLMQLFRKFKVRKVDIDTLDIGIFDGYRVFEFTVPDVFKNESIRPGRPGKIISNVEIASSDAEHTTGEHSISINPILGLNADGTKIVTPNIKFDDDLGKNIYSLSPVGLSKIFICAKYEDYSSLKLKYSTVRFYFRRPSTTQTHTIIVNADSIVEGILQDDLSIVTSTDYFKELKLPEIPIETQDWNDMVTRFNLIMSNADELVTTHRLSTAQGIKIPENCRLIEMRILFQEKGETDDFKLKTLSIDTSKKYLSVDKDFAIKFYNGSIYLLKSDNIDQVFIRNINFIK